MTDLIGQSLGRYHILEQLGEGGMATVYKAFDTRLERHVAIKIILTQKQQTEKFLQRFEREARALAQLTHPNIVGIIDYGEYEGMPYLVMEYLPSGTLKPRLGKPIPYREAARMLAPIARALAYAHDQKIIHRDVKPANILITQSGEPMLSDFGIAKILEAEETFDLTGTGVGVGTPEYMSPEQAQGKPVDAKSDIYSLGVVFFEMVAGRKPYQADTPLAILLKSASEPLPRPRQFVPDLPEAVEGVLIKALAKNPEDRYPDMGTFAVVLEGLVSSHLKAGKSPHFRKGSFSNLSAQSGQKAGNKKLLPAIKTILLLVAVIVVGAGLFWLGQKGSGSLAFEQAKSPTLPSTLLFDDFNNSIYDGTFDGSKWRVRMEIDPAQMNYIQNGGVLIGTLGPFVSYDFEIHSSQNLEMDKIEYVEWRVKIAEAVRGDWASLALGLESEDGNRLTCDFRGHDNTLTCIFWKLGGSINDIKLPISIPIKPGSWYTLRVEIIPAPGPLEFKFYLNDQVIYTYLLKDIDLWSHKNVHLYSSLGVENNENDLIGYIDKVIVGGR